MKKVLFLTNYPAPYRVRFFDELGKYVDLTVLFTDRAEDQKHRSAAWFESSKGNYRIVELKKKLLTVRGATLFTDVLDWVKGDFDAVIVSGYSNPSFALAMAYLRMKKKRVYMEIDGGLIRPDPWFRGLIKRTLIQLPTDWISTGRATTEYLVHYGAKEDRVHEYPFSSLYEKDILEKPVTREEKLALRRELGIESENMVLSIGQFIHRKAFDILLKAAAKLPQGTDIYIVGGEPTEEYLQLCKELNLQNVHFEGFMKKEKLTKYYMAADLFALPTREDIWGLVINEAMAYGLPVITTDRCVAGLTLLRHGVSGYIIPTEDVDALADKIQLALGSDCAAMGAAALEQVRPYTLENMAKTHVRIVEGRE